MILTWFGGFLHYSEGLGCQLGAPGRRCRWPTVMAGPPSGAGWRADCTGNVLHWVGLVTSDGDKSDRLRAKLQLEVEG